MRLDASTPIYLSDTYVNKLTGFFRAPVSGDYKFFASGDDIVELFLATEAETTERSKL